MRIALLIQYDGSEYFGWQIQSDPNTVQGLLEKTLQKVFDNPSGLTGSGRTDSGVHALGQVAHFDIAESSIPPENIWMALNRHLPDDIRVVASKLVNEDFHSRFMAIERSYQYEISLTQNVLMRKSQWYVRYTLDMDKMHQVSRLILGSHDFSSFCYAGTETENMVCNIASAEWHASASQSLSFQIKADRFLHHMVRMLVGSMVEVGRGKWEIDHFKYLLENPDRQAHAVTAPANGLSLLRVKYPQAAQPVWNN